MSWTPFTNRIPNWRRLLTILGVGFPVGISLRFLLGPGCPTCINTWFLFTLSHIANLTSLLSNLRKILENLYCLLKRGVDQGGGPLVPITYCNVSYISKKLKLGLDMAKVHRALNIPLRFHEWRWLLSECREEDDCLPLAEDVERWKKNNPDPDNLSARQEECPDEPPSKRKADTKNVSPLKKKPKLPFAEKTQVGVVPASSAMVKHLVGAYRKKIGGMRNIRDVPLKPLADEFGDRDLLRKVVRARSSSPVERQRDADAPLRIKHGVDSLSPIPLEVRLAEASKAKESSTWAKGSSAMSGANLKVDKSSPVGDAGMSDLLKTHFLSSPSACAELLSELEKKNAELVSKLSAEQTRYEKKTSDLTTMIFELKSSLAEKDSKLNSSIVDLASRKDAYFHLEHKSVNISHNYDKLLARFRAYHKSAEESNSESTMDAYKLGYLDYTNGNDPFYAIGDEDIEMLCPDLLPV
ncbi:unnamed protein product [Prunus armeniaca]